MKCPMCLGKGYATDEDIKEYPHRCPNCNGKGFYSVDWQKVRCEVCNGSGKKPMTNEEWVKSLDTEGLVDYLYEVHKGGNSVERQSWIENHKERVKMQFRGWLEEIHHAN